MKIWLKTVLYVAIGAGGGFAYYYYVGCVSGTCPITSNPYISTLYGASIGLLIGADMGKIFNKRKQKDNQ
ncbi:MAG TPA: DUF6132 family protein [Bacteroidota bacterium]